MPDGLSPIHPRTMDRLLDELSGVHLDVLGALCPTEESSTFNVECRLRVYLGGCKVSGTLRALVARGLAVRIPPSASSGRPSYLITYRGQVVLDEATERALDAPVIR